MLELRWTQEMIRGEQPERFRPELIKIILGLLILLTLVSQGAYDPDPLSLVSPSTGVQNWFGLPGALFAGFWLRFFGWSSLILVAFLLFSQSTKKRFLPAFMAATIHFLGFSLLFGLIFPPGHQKITYFSGLYGLVGNQGFSEYGLRFLGVLVLTAFLIKASLGYRLKAHFILFGVQGVLGILGALAQVLQVFLELREFTPNRIKETLLGAQPKGFGNPKDELVQPKSDDLLMRKALESLSNKNKSLSSSEEEEK